jgi:ATP-dependent Lon protease
LAAKRAKVRRVILPKANQADYSRLAGSVKRGLPVHFVETFSEVLATCFPKTQKKRGVVRPPVR